MDYGQLFKRGWNILWNHKFLWLLGFLAALGGNSISGQASFNFSGGGGGGGSTTGPMDPEIEQFFEGLAQGNFPPLPAAFQAIFTAIIVFICCATLFFIIMYFVRLVAEGGMIHAVVDIEAGRTSSFGQAMAGGRPHLLPFWGTRLLLGLPNFLVALLFFIVIGSIVVSALRAPASFEPRTLLVAVPILLCSGLILFPYSLFIALIIPISQRGIALQRMGVLDSIRHAWQILKQNTAEVLILAVIYVLGGMLFGIVVALVTLPFVALTALPLIFTIFEQNAPGFFQIALFVIGIIVAAILSAVLSAVFVSYRSTTFTLAYLDFTGSAPAKEPAAPLPEAA